MQFVKLETRQQLKSEMQAEFNNLKNEIEKEIEQSLNVRRKWSLRNSHGMEKKKRSRGPQVFVDYFDIYSLDNFPANLLEFFLFSWNLWG